MRTRHALPHLRLRRRAERITAALRSAGSRRARAAGVLLGLLAVLAVTFAGSAIEHARVADEARSLGAEIAGIEARIAAVTAEQALLGDDRHIAMLARARGWGRPGEVVFLVRGPSPSPGPVPAATGDGPAPASPAEQIARFLWGPFGG